MRRTGNHKRLGGLRPLLRIFAATMAMGMVVAACSTEEGTDDTPSASESVSEEAPDDSDQEETGDEETAAPDDSAAAGGEVSFFGWDVADTSAGLGKGFDAARVEWEAQGDGDRSVTFDGVPFGEFVAAATTRARAGELSDVVEMLPGLNHAPVWPALTPLSPDDWDGLGDELTGWDAGIIDVDDPEQVAGVPIGAQGVVWYFNKSLFEQAGLDPEQPPTTWDEFTAAAQALADEGITPIGMSGVDSNLAWWAWSAFSPQFYTTTDELLAVRNGETPLTDDGLLAGLEALRETYESGWWNEDFRDLSFPDVEAAFGRGEIAMVPGLITSAMNWAVWDSTLGAGTYGVFGAPELPGASGRGQFFNPTLLYGINSETDNEAGARSWISFLASQEGQTILLREAGQFPNRDDVDVEEVSGSEGAAQISEVVAELGGMDVVQNQFTSAAQNAALQQLTSALTDGDLEGFLAELDQQQQQQ